MMKRILFGFFIVFMNLGIAQDISFEDSLLWSSPVSARAVRFNHIKKITVSEKGWNLECKNCPDHPKPGMFKNVYRNYETTFEYDTLGFPVRIIKSGYRQKNENIYNSGGQLVKSEFFFKNDKGKLLSVFRNLREYNPQGLLSKSTMYYRNELFRINDYSYDSSGRIIELNDKRTHFSCLGCTNFDIYMIVKYEYDQNNRLYRKSELSPRADPKAKWNNRSCYFYYDVGNKDSVTIYLFDSDTTSTAIWSAFSPKIKTWVIKDHSHDQVSELRAIDILTDDMNYIWDFNYEDGVVWPRCRIYQLKTGLILSEKKEGLRQQLPKSAVKNSVMTPENIFGYEFSDKATNISYKYTYRN